MNVLLLEQYCLHQIEKAKANLDTYSSFKNCHQGNKLSQKADCYFDSQLLHLMNLYKNLIFLIF